MKNTKLFLAISFLPIIITAFFLRFMDDIVSTHYDINGAIDRWGSKYENLIFPVIIICISIIWTICINYYKKAANKKSNEKEREEAYNNIRVLNIVGLSMISIFCVLQCVFIYMAFVNSNQQFTTSEIDIFLCSNILISLFVIIIGNHMTKIKRNSILGLRTAGSMSNEKAWAASNKFAGIIFIIIGILTIVLSLIIKGITSVIIMLVLILTGTIVSCSYSGKFKD